MLHSAPEQIKRLLFLFMMVVANNVIAVSTCPQSSVTTVTVNGEQTFPGYLGIGREKTCTNEFGLVSQFNFAGKAGQKIFLDASSEATSLALRIYLKYPTAGAAEASGQAGSPVRWPQTGYMTLPTDGDYWFFVGSTTGKAGGPFTLKIGTDVLTPEPGFWWNPAESGRGFVIEKQGGSLMVATFLYKPDGSATWYLSAGPMNDGATFVHTLDAFIGGQCLDCVYKPPTQTTGAGNMEIKFTSGTTAIVKWSGAEFPIQRLSF